MDAESHAYHALCCATLARRDEAFLHQHVVDAHAAQTVDATEPPIRLVFALVGLYLHVERRLTGRQVQRAHMTLAQRRRVWPTLPLPEDRGRITALTVLATAEGPARDTLISAWAACVWDCYRNQRTTIEDLLAECHLQIGP